MMYTKTSSPLKGFKTIMVVILLTSANMFSQNYFIQGPTSLYYGDPGYFYVTGTNISSVTWTTGTNGTVVSSSSNYANIKFHKDAIGLIDATIRDTNFNYYYDDWSVTLSIGPPPDPVIDRNNCGTATLERTEDPPTGTGLTWYWQGKNANGTSTTLGFGATYLADQGSGTYYIRAQNKKGVWGAESGSVYVSMNNAFSPGSIGNAQTICYGNNPSLLTNVSGASGGDNTYAYQWESSPNGSSWSAISGATSASYDPPVLYSDTWYRRKATSCIYTQATSVIKITVTPMSTWYADTDGDGFGNPASSVSNCNQPAGYVANNSDYDDSTVMITNLAPQTFYRDTDGDGFGEPTPNIYASFKPLGYADNTSDQCPEIPGPTNGCDYETPVYSDENYVYTRVYQSEMALPTEVTLNRDVLESIVYYDGLGRPKQQIAIKGSTTQSNSISPNYPAEWIMDWTEGTGGTGFYNANGATSENARSQNPDPFGNNALIWACGNDPDNDADGGWNTDYFNVDKTKTYRYTVWVRRDYSNNGKTYHGTRNVDYLGGGANGNPYFWQGDLPQLGEWYLLVGIVHPYGYAGGDSGVSGVYDMQGNKVDDGEEYKWSSTTTTSSFRSYLYYATDVNVRQYFFQPILEIVDGNEIPLQDMFDTAGPKDLVTHMDYDNFARQDKEWLPYPETTGAVGSYRGDVSTATQQYYKNKFPDDFAGQLTTEVNAFSKKLIEPSPLGRILKAGAPGGAWKVNETSNDNTIEFGYQASTSTDMVRQFRVVTTKQGDKYVPTLEFGVGKNATVQEFYTLGALYKNVTKDENHISGRKHTSEEFTDKQGRVVLKRTYADIDGQSNVAHDTYYVYDDYGNLTYVLPPLIDATNQTLVNIVGALDDLGYQYIYDGRNRLVEKRIPGKGWEYIVYNVLDQPVMTQDAEQRPNKQWLFTKYDALGRVAYTGLHTQANVISRTTMQGYADNATAYDQHEAKQGTSTVLAGTTIYYSNNAIPQSITELYTINYYDDYDAARDGIARPVGQVLGQDQTTDVTGLPTATKVRVLGTTVWTTALTVYDQKGRPIWTKSTNDYLNTTDMVETKLDFVGKVEQTKTTHQRTGFSDIVTVDTFTYDDLGRLESQQQTINGQGPETLVHNVYDDLGQLATKQVGGGLQTVDYDYNVRGWLTQINDPSSLGNDLFAFGINYNDPQYGGAALYNGNISETKWRTANNDDNSLKHYRYSYDALNRITEALDDTGKYSLTGVTYDRMGNIMTLKRQGWTIANPILSSNTGLGPMDDLTYQYNGNQLINVADDNASDTYGFVDVDGNGTEYGYDDNGNMTSDANKGITSITYNHLNLPTDIVTGQGNISYVYDAAGTKLQKTVSVGSSVTAYAGNYVYSGNTTSTSLQFFSHPEGYVYPDGQGGYEYVYQYKDHLGNVRLSYTDDPSNPGTPTIIEENNYYPFGLKHKGYNEGVSSFGNSVANKWKFGGKEYDDSFNDALATYDFGARNYDPALGRWMNLDPLAEQMRRHSPYNYAFDNPVYFVDPDGMMPQGPNPIKRLLKKLAKSGKFVAKNSKGQLKPISRVHAQKLLKMRKSVFKTTDGSTNKKAKRLMKEVAKDKTVVRHDGHKLKNLQGIETGKEGLPHFQKKSGDGSHVFFDNAKTTATTVAVGGAAASANAAEGDASTLENSNTDNISTSESSNQEVPDFVVDMTDVGATMTDAVENFGTNVFGDNDLGKFVDELNPINLGFSDYFKFAKETFDSKKKEE